MDQDQNIGGTSAPQSAPSANIMDTSTKSNLAPILIGTVIVVAVMAIILGYMMMGGATSTTVAPVVNTTHTTGTTVNADGTQAAAPDAATTALAKQGTSDDVTAIDADLKATDLGSLNSSGI